MRLLDLYEDELGYYAEGAAIQRAGQKHLVVAAEDYERMVIFVISDIPRTITSEQWDKLLEASFSTTDAEFYIHAIPFGYVDPDTGWESEEEFYKNLPSYPHSGTYGPLPWKKAFEAMISEVDSDDEDDEDDFSE